MGLEKEKKKERMFDDGRCYIVKSEPDRESRADPDSQID